MLDEESVVTVTGRAERSWTAGALGTSGTAPCSCEGARRFVGVGTAPSAMAGLFLRESVHPALASRPIRCQG